MKEGPVEVVSLSKLDAKRRTLVRGVHKLEDEDEETRSAGLFNTKTQREGINARDIELKLRQCDRPTKWGDCGGDCMSKVT